MTTPAENQNWQKRQYDSFGPHFRIETANPELGLVGNVAYNLYGYSDSKDVSNLGMMGDGQFQIMADQCITIAGGASVEGGGLCINIVGTKGDVAISAEKNGDVRIKGRNIFLDASENIELTTGGKIELDSAELLATTQNTTRIHARKTKVSGRNIDIGGSTDITLITPKGSIKVKRIVAREVDWSGAVFANTSVPANALKSI
jgi:hypothetical protein|tara:strand:+ start:495 stop:1103 length:609 start_codon:yes stop_codon:yes gene_type:complete